MAARLIDGKAVSAEVRERVRAEVMSTSAKPAGPQALATVLVGEDPASADLRRQQAPGLRGGRASARSITSFRRTISEGELVCFAPPGQPTTT